jgi:hypothetical protein
VFLEVAKHWLLKNHKLQDTKKNESPAIEVIQGDEENQLEPTNLNQIAISLPAPMPVAKQGRTEHLPPLQDRQESVQDNESGFVTLESKE